MERGGDGEGELPRGCQGGGIATAVGVPRQCWGHNVYAAAGRESSSEHAVALSGWCCQGVVVEVVLTDRWWWVVAAAAGRENDRSSGGRASSLLMLRWRRGISLTSALLGREEGDGWCAAVLVGAAAGRRRRGRNQKHTNSTNHKLGRSKVNAQTTSGARDGFADKSVSLHIRNNIRSQLSKPTPSDLFDIRFRGGTSMTSASINS